MIKSSVVLALVCLVMPGLRRRSAAERHLVWAATLVAASLLPVLNLLVPSWYPEWARQLMAVLPSSFDASVRSPLGQTADIVVRANGVETTAWTPAHLWPALWMVGTGVAALLLAVDLLKLARLARSAQPVPDARLGEMAREIADALHLGCTPLLLQSAQCAVPMTWGVRRPRVLLPSGATAWSDDRIRVVLAHELAHVSRGDWVVQLVAEIACAVYWFHPLFWVARNRVHRESEHAADDVALGLGLEASDYAGHLLAIVRDRQIRVSACLPTVAMARPSDLERRFAALLTACVNRRGMTRRNLVAAVCMAILAAIPLAAVSLTQAAMNVTIRTTGLPAMAEMAAVSSRENAAPAAQHLRTVGLGDRAEALTPPDIVEYTTPPLYSEEARARRIEGLVIVGARVEADGRVTGVRLVRGLGFGLDQNAVVAVRQWRFRPGTREGVPAAMDAEIDVLFSLRNDGVNALIANDMATRVGPGVVPPRAVRFVELRQSTRTRGTVVLDVVLLEDGTPKIVRILQSLNPDLDERAVRTFEQWRFTPAMKNGRPVKVRMNAEVNFRG